MAQTSPEPAFRPVSGSSPSRVLILSTDEIRWRVDLSVVVLIVLVLLVLLVISSQTTGG